MKSCILVKDKQLFILKPIQILYMKYIKIIGFLTCCIFLSQQSFAQQKGFAPKSKVMDTSNLRKEIKMDKKERDPKKVAAKRKNLELRKAEAEAMANSDGQISNSEWDIIEAYERRLEQLTTNY
jgi:hypothetical protein